MEKRIENFTINWYECNG